MISLRCRFEVADAGVDEGLRDWVDLGVVVVCLATGDGVGANIHFGSLRVFSPVVSDSPSS